MHSWMLKGLHVYFLSSHMYVHLHTCSLTSVSYIYESPKTKVGGKGGKGKGGKGRYK